VRFCRNSDLPFVLEYRYNVSIRKGAGEIVSELRADEKTDFIGHFKNETDFIGHFKNETLNIFIGAINILRQRIEKWYQLEDKTVTLEQMTISESEAIALEIAKIAVVAEAPPADPRCSKGLDSRVHLRAILDHLPKFAYINAHYEEDINGETATFSGHAIKTDHDRWQGTFSSSVVGAMRSLEFCTDDLMNPPFRVDMQLVPQMETSMSNMKKANDRRQRRDVLIARRQMEQEALTKVEQLVDIQDRQFFEETKKMEHFADFKCKLNEITAPFKIDVEVANPCSGENEKMAVNYRRGVKGDSAAISTLALERVDKILAPTTAPPANKRVNRKVVNTKFGGNTVDAIHQLKEADRKERHDENVARIQRMKKKAESLTELLHCFETHKSSRPSNFWVLQEKDGKKVLDLFLKLFFPDSGMLSKTVGEKRNYLQDKINSVDCGIDFSMNGLNDFIDLKKAELELMHLEICDDNSSSDDDSN